MPTRRSYVALLAGVGFVSLAGCASDGGGGTPQPTGDRVTHGGVDLAVTEYTTIDSFTKVQKLAEDDYSVGETKTAGSGELFLLVKVIVSNTDESAHPFPLRDDVEVIYNGEPQSDAATGSDMRANGTVYSNYVRAMEENGGHRGSPNTTVEGWVVFEVPEGFTASDAKVTIEWGDGDADIERKTFRWQL